MGRLEGIPTPFPAQGIVSLVENAYGARVSGRLFVFQHPRHRPGLLTHSRDSLVADSSLTNPSGGGFRTMGMGGILKDIKDISQPTNGCKTGCRSRDTLRIPGGARIAHARAVASRVPLTRKQRTDPPNGWSTTANRSSRFGTRLIAIPPGGRWPLRSTYRDGSRTFRPSRVDQVGS